MKKRKLYFLSHVGIILLVLAIPIFLFTDQQPTKTQQFASGGSACSSGTSGSYTECTNSASLCAQKCGTAMLATVHWTCGTDLTQQYTCGSCGGPCGGGSSSGGGSGGGGGGNSSSSSPSCTSGSYIECTNSASLCAASCGVGYLAAVSYTCGADGTRQYTCGSCGGSCGGNSSSSAPVYWYNTCVQGTCQRLQSTSPQSTVNQCNPPGSSCGSSNSNSSASNPGNNGGGSGGQPPAPAPHYLTCDNVGPGGGFGWSDDPGHNPVARCPAYDTCQNDQSGKALCRLTQCGNGSVCIGYFTIPKYGPPINTCQQSNSITNICGKDQSGNGNFCCQGGPFGGGTIDFDPNAHVTFAIEGLAANPQHVNRSFVLHFTPVNGGTAITIPGTGTYDPTTGSFMDGIVPLSNIPPGQYHIVLHLDGSLDAELLQTDGSNTFTFPGILDPQLISLIPGDIEPTPDNFIDVIDYNILIGCLGKQPTGMCKNADLNGDGVIDQKDVDLLLGNFGLLGFSLSTPQFTCSLDPNCLSGQGTLQMCALICTRQPGN